MSEDREKLKDIAKKVIAKAGLANEEKFGSVMAILMVISIVLTVVRILQECNKKESALCTTIQQKTVLYGDQIRTFSVNRGWFTKMRIKKILRKELSPDDYKKYSIQLLSGLLTVGEDVTDDEVTTLVEASNV